ncbi:MAG: NAD(+)/NADH kinase [Calditrichia bacterium]
MPAFGLFGNPQKKIIAEKLPDLLKIMNGPDVKVFCAEDMFGGKVPEGLSCEVLPPAEVPGNCDMVIVFGGDGTILRAAHNIGSRQTPILGVNVGGLGFLTEVLLEDFGPVFNQILKGDYRTEKRLMLQGVINDEKEPLFALNEFTVEKGRSTRVIEVKVHIDGIFFNDYIADGLIFSTPTGSTGYSLSSGGPIVVPTSRSIILNPICPHSLTNRPVIMPADCTITAEIYTDFPQILLSADNQEVREIPSNTHFRMERAPFDAHLVKLPNSDYFSLLRDKLGWGGDFRNKDRWTYNR